MAEGSTSEPRQRATASGNSRGLQAVNQARSGANHHDCQAYGEALRHASLPAMLASGTLGARQSLLECTHILDLDGVSLQNIPRQIIWIQRDAAARSRARYLSYVVNFCMKAVIFVIVCLIIRFFFDFQIQAADSDEQPIESKARNKGSENRSGSNESINGSVLAVEESIARFVKEALTAHHVLQPQPGTPAYKQMYEEMVATETRRHFEWCRLHKCETWAAGANVTIQADVGWNCELTWSVSSHLCIGVALWLLLSGRLAHLKRLSTPSKNGNRVRDKKLRECPFKCGQTLEANLIKAHMRDCHLRTKWCHACRSHVLLKNFGRHEKMECPGRNMLCPDCGSEVDANAIADHADACPGCEVQCTCGIKCRERRLDDHLWACGEARVVCPDCSLGMIQADMMAHVCPAIVKCNSCIVCCNIFEDEPPAAFLHRGERVCNHFHTCLSCASTIANGNVPQCPECRSCVDGARAVASHLVIKEALDTSQPDQLVGNGFKMVLSCSRPSRARVERVRDSRNPPRIGETLWLSPLMIHFTHDTINPVFGDGKPILQTVENIIRGILDVDDIPRVKVVWLPSEERFYVAGTYNRRLCAYRLLAIYVPGKFRRIKVQVASLDDPTVHFREKKTTACQGRFVHVRVGKRRSWPTVGISVDDTTWQHAQDLITSLAEPLT